MDRVLTIRRAVRGAHFTVSARRRDLAQHLVNGDQCGVSGVQATVSGTAAMVICGAGGDESAGRVS